MTRAIPEWLHDQDHDTDRVLLAAWLHRDGEWEAAAVLLRSVSDTNPRRNQVAMNQLSELLDMHDRLSDGGACDIRDLAYTQYGVRLPSGSWQQWAESQIEEIRGDIVSTARAHAHPVLTGVRS